MTGSTTTTCCRTRPTTTSRPGTVPTCWWTTGLHDSQVQYWEPAKWVAKLRAVKTDHNRLLLKINMEAGHGGASGRFKRYREIALEYAFLLDSGRDRGVAAGAGTGGFETRPYRCPWRGSV